MQAAQEQAQNGSSRKNNSRLSKNGNWRSFPKIPNLLQYVTSGTYFARVKIKGKIIRQSLETDVWTTAKLKLLDFLKEQQNHKRDHKQFPLFSHAVEQFKQEVGRDASMKDSSKHYRMICIRKIELTRPELWKKRIDEITLEECKEWGAKLREEIASQYFNNTVNTLRLILDMAIENHRKAGGVPIPNPAKELAPARIKSKQLKLPEPDQFRELVAHVRKQNSWGKASTELIEFLAYSGLRLYTEAHWVTWEDIDWTRKEIVVRGNSQTGTKNWEMRRIPILPNMEELLQRLAKQREQPLAGKILRILECPKTLKEACKAIGIPALRHHDLRHLFATRCIESGVDIPTVSRWLGHKDGGALAMKVYGHLRNEHSQAMAQKVRF